MEIRVWQRGLGAGLAAIAGGVVAALCAWPERFIVDDAYFYLVTARNLALHGEQTFSQVWPTNGVHPLWLWLLAAWSWLVARVDASWLFNARSVLPPTLLLATATALLALRLADRLALPRWPGAVLPVAFGLGLPLLGTEAALSALTLAWALHTWLDAHRSTRAALLFALASALAVLSRLDNLFVIMALHGALWLRPGHRRAQLWALLPLAAWLAVNAAQFGALVPVSGLLKSTFPQICANGLQRDGINTAFSGYNLVFGWLPLLATAAVAVRLRRRAPAVAQLLAALAVGCAGHAAYTALFTHHVGSWLWHYTVPVVMGAWALAAVAQHLVAIRWRPLAIAAMTLLPALAVAGYAARAATRAQTGDEALRVRDWLHDNQVTDATLLVSDAQGAIAFASTNRVIGLDLLTANPACVRTALAAPNALESLLQQARDAGHPIDFIVLTSDTWLAKLWPMADGRALEFAFLQPGTCGTRTRARLAVAAPVWQAPGLTVWRAPR